MIPKRLAMAEGKKTGRKRGSKEKRGSEGWMERGRERGRKRGRKGKDSRKAREGKERKESERRRREKGKERGRKSALGERGARSTCTLYERNPRRRRWAVVHFMHDYARLYWIPCTPTLDYPEYHARLRLIIWIPCTPLTDSSISGLRFGPICSIFYENSK